MHSVKFQEGLISRSKSAEFYFNFVLVSAAVENCMFIDFFRYPVSSAGGIY